MVNDPQIKLRYAEFFAGGGMVSAALHDTWSCVFANDVDAKKCAVYRANFPNHPLIEGDIATLDPGHLRQPIDLYWASSPCQDFSLAGRGAGLAGRRSGVFRDWIDHLSHAVTTGFAPRVIAFENVTGLLAPKRSQDFKFVFQSIENLGYRVGAMEIDAASYLPHSRPRLFVVGIRKDVAVPPELVADKGAALVCHTNRIRSAVAGLPADCQRRFVWWNFEPMVRSRPTLDQVIDIDEGPFLSRGKTADLVAMMSPVHHQRLTDIRASDQTHIGFAYKRGRPDQTGRVRQVAEIRFDGVAGCIRTPAGGSSRQIVLIAGQGRLDARLLRPREAVRLMGLGDDYRLLGSFNDGYRVAGDGVAVPVVADLSRQLLLPLVNARAKAIKAA